MVLTELDQSQSKLLGALTLTALKHLGENTGLATTAERYTIAT